MNPAAPNPFTPHPHLRFYLRLYLRFYLRSSFHFRFLNALQSLLLLTTLLLAMSPPAHAIDEPTYSVVQKTDVFEVRQYAPYWVAEVVVPGPASAAGSQGFSLLGGYIFGKNKGERKLEMTAPVTQTAAPAAPMKLDMTAPVTQAATQGGFLVQFVMPKGYTLATLPRSEERRVGKEC